MTPFIDRGISLLETPIKPITSTVSESTKAFDPYRQGVEVSLFQHYAGSTIPYASSKGIKALTIGGEVDHEIDYVNFGQGINLNGFSSFEDKSERKSAVEILVENIIQDDTDPYFTGPALDGQIEIFGDTGKRSLMQTSNQKSARGIKGASYTFGGMYNLNDVDKSYFFDSSENMLGLAVQGYSGVNDSYDAFNDRQLVNKFSFKIDYTYIGPDEKSPKTGFDYYGSDAGTDSVAFGGWLR